MFTLKKIPSFRNYRINYCLMPDTQEYPREINFRARSKDHARKLMHEKMRHASCVYEIIDIY